VENDFNKKYEEFLDGQAGYPQTILQKRQSELQEMLNKNIAFKKESLQLLSKAEAEALAPLKEKLNSVLAQIGQERGLAFILNTDVNAVPWLNVAMGENLTEAVKELLK
jgi:outer membrane protein